MTVELIWDGKYTADGKKSSPLRVPLPFQTVETVNESVQERQRMLDLFSAGRDGAWRNRLIWGDKKYVLPSLLPEFAGKVNLIYIDPPFDTGADFSFNVEVEGETFTKEPSVIEQKAYRDTWGRGLDSYLQWFYETAVMLRELLAEDGSVYVHLDWHVGHYAKSVLDEVFGQDNFRSEIIREKANPKNYTKLGYGNIHDVIFFYTKSDSFSWSKPYIERDEDKIRTDFPLIDNERRRYKTAPLHAPGVRSGETGKPWRGLMPPSGNHWRYVHDTLNQLDNEGRIEWSSTGNPRERIYANESSGLFLQDIWLGVKDEKSDYPTQKPEAILERIIKASSNEGDIVLDCFCGSGTTAAVSEKLNRRWITCDLGRFAIHTARKRLLAIPGVKPFVVQNLGKYERQLWQADEFGPEAAERIAAYTRFILDLYHAQPLTGYTWLHGIKHGQGGGRIVHVGAVDSPVTLSDVKSIIIEWQRNLGKTGAGSNGIDVLGWEFAFELHETARQQAAEAGVDLRFCIIPREVLEKKAVEQGDIQFFELAALSVAHKIKKRELTLTLTNFIAPLEYVPMDVREKITRWESWIDYWAVDFDFKGDTFHNQWQSYRTRKNKKLEAQAAHTYAEPGSYLVQVKVIDILGNDTTRTLRVEVS